MRSRPDVELRMPSFVHPGSPLLVELRIASGSITPIDFISLELTGMEYLRVAAASAHRVSRFLVQTARVADAGTLAVGEHRYQAVFPLPSEAYPSYQGQLFQYRYFLKLHVSIPWWPDVVQHYDAVVRPPEAQRRSARPFAATSASGNAPFVEISIADQYFEPGEVIEGGLAYGNLGGQQARQVALSLLGYERFKPYGAHEAYRFTAFKPLDDVKEGDEVGFRFAVPRDVTPSFDAGQHASLFWALEAQIEPKHGAAVTHAVPVTLARFDRPAAPSAMRRRVGSGRWHAVWAEVGKGAGLGLDPTELELSGPVGRCFCAVKIGTDDDGKKGLVGEVRWESWGLGLTIRDRRMLDFGLDLPDEAFARRFRVRARDGEQVREALGRPLLAALSTFDQVYLDDAHAVVRSRTPGHDQPWIGHFVRQLLALAEAIGGAADAIPPPPALGSCLGAYARFAEELGARVERGSLSLRGGRLDGVPVIVETDFARDERPRGTTLGVELDPPLRESFDPARAEHLAAASPATRHLLDEVGRLLAALDAEAAPGAGDGRAIPPVIDERSIRVTTRAPLSDPASARALLGTMIALGGSLRGERKIGPYR
ncbi:MAG: hypothetical protein U0359_03905 [Byssovorax sp.]